MRKLLFISNLFPDSREPYRGLDNATVLHHLLDRWDIRVLGLRPTLPWHRRTYEPRAVDAPFQPHFLSVPYLPKIGSRVNHLLMARALSRHVSRQAHKPDLILSSWIYPDSCAVARLSREQALPFVAIAQGSDVHQYLRMPARRQAIVRYLPDAKAVITRSAELARLLAEAGLPAKRLHPVYNGVDRSIFHPGDRMAARLALGIPANVQLVLFVGNFYPIKNPITLLEAHASMLSEAGKDVHLMLVGGGELEGKMRAFATGAGTTSRIHYAGRQDAAGVALRMQAADVLCLPSDNEGVPNVILEAFTCGIPVVASRVGGIPEVHTGDTLGLLVPPRNPQALAQALCAVLREPTSREIIAAYAGQFTWTRAADKYHELLESALKPLVHPSSESASR